MGQQQLLLIILGVIIVGIAVAVGINMFTASASASNRDAVTSDLTNLASMAQQHFRRPAAMGGGNNCFSSSNGGTNWALPAQLDTTANGTYTASLFGCDSVTITGVGTEIGNNGTTSVSVTTTVTPTAIRARLIN